MTDTIHTFALFYEHVPSKQSVMVIRDADPLFHRIVHILRLEKGDSVIFFNREHHVQASLSKGASRELVFECEDSQPNQIYQPTITCLLPILKREAFDEAVYAVTECGASSIQPIITKKVHRSWGADRERDRVMRVITAAAEQSKNYAMVDFHEPKNFSDVIDEYSRNSTLVWCDPSGMPFSKVLAELARIRPVHVSVLVGPEGDLTLDEKQVLIEKKVIRMSLTPTILRAHQAIALAIGALRSDLNS